MAKQTRQELKKRYLKYWKYAQKTEEPLAFRLSWSKWLKHQKIKLPPRKVKRSVKSLYVRPRTEKALKRLRRKRKK